MDCLVTYIIGIITGGFAMALIASARCSTCHEEIARILEGNKSTGPSQLHPPQEADCEAGARIKSAVRARN